MKKAHTVPLAIAVWCSTARAFSTSPPGAHIRQPLQERLSLPALSVSATANLNNNASDDSVLKQFQRKEKELQRRKEEAARKLDEFDKSLAKLQASKKQYEAASQVADVFSPGGSFSETTLRSAVKAFCWRLIAGSITFATTLQFSKSVQVALQVVAGDFFSKAITMFIGERIMNKSQAGRAKGGDNVGRSVIKALVWRLFAVSNTLCMAIFVSKDWSIAGKIASTDAVFKTSLMFFYERMWAKIDWGKDYLMEYSI